LNTDASIAQRHFYCVAAISGQCSGKLSRFLLHEAGRME
jgi:hypothetical protein